MTIAKVEIQYGYNEQDKYTHRMYFGAGDSSNKLLGPQVDVPRNPTDIGAVNEISSYVQAYLVCLEEIAQPEIKIITAFAEQYDDTPGRVVIHNVSYDVTSFQPNVTNLGKLGPRGVPFIGGRQPIAATRRYGWMRWHYIGGNFMRLPALITPSQISSRFATSYDLLRNITTPLDGYETITNSLGVSPVYTPKATPSVQLHFGIRNG